MSPMTLTANSRSQASHSIFLVTGPVQAGKTTFLTSVAELLENEHIAVGGFLCPGTFTSGLRAGFDLKQIGSDLVLCLATDRSREGYLKFRRFWFNPQAFTRGQSWIDQCLEQHKEILIIDEVGPMELEGGGWSSMLDGLAEKKGPVQCWSVRKALVQEVMERWQIGSGQVIDIGQETPQQARDRLLCRARSNQSTGKHA